MRITPAVLPVLLCALEATAVARPRVDTSGPARAACAKALARGELDAIRVGWTAWPTREIWESVVVERGRLTRSGGQLKNAKKVRPLTDGEKKALLDALRAARVDKLVWVDRDVKNGNDRVLNLDVLRADREPTAVGAFVRIGSTWRSGTTAALAELLERWLQEK
jgi:hypothetical protein